MSRLLFVSSNLQVTWWALANEKEQNKMHRMIIPIITTLTSSVYCFLLTAALLKSVLKVPTSNWLDREAFKLREFWNVKALKCSDFSILYRAVARKNYACMSNACPWKTYDWGNLSIDCFHDPIMQHVLGGSLHKNNTSCLLLGLYYASVNWLSIVLV